MNQILIDAVGVLDQFPTVEHMFDFYPHGFKGLIADLLKYHFTHPDGGDECDQILLDDIMDKYHASAQYQAMLRDPEGPAREQYLVIAIYMVHRTTWEFVRYHRAILAACKLKPDSIQLGSAFEYVLLEHV
jgi:hypothetical protein